MEQSSIRVAFYRDANLSNLIQVMSFNSEASITQHTPVETDDSSVDKVRLIPLSSTTWKIEGQPNFKFSKLGPGTEENYAYMTPFYIGITKIQINKVKNRYNIAGYQGTKTLFINQISMQPYVSLGSSMENDIVLTDRFASRKHAVIELQSNYYIVNDCNSANGIWVTSLNDKISEKRILRIGLYTFIEITVEKPLISPNIFTPIMPIPANPQIRQSRNMFNSISSNASIGKPTIEQLQVNQFASVNTLKLVRNMRPPVPNTPFTSVEISSPGTPRIMSKPSVPISVDSKFAEALNLKMTEAENMINKYSGDINAKKILEQIRGEYTDSKNLPDSSIILIIAAFKMNSEEIWKFLSENSSKLNY